jgi:putative ABC transport system permease protein
MTPMGRDGFHVRLYRALLRLFPAEFRGDFGDQMTADFDDERRDVLGTPREVRKLWIRTAADLLRRAPREHLDVLWRDSTYAVRILLRHPAWAATAVISLAVGIGLNSAVFSVVSGVLWRDLPFHESDRLVMVGQFTAADTLPAMVPPTVLLDIQRQSRTLDRVGGGRFDTITTLEPEPAELGCLAVSDGFFETLGARPAIGREFNQADYAPSLAHWARQTKPRASPEPAVVALSHTVWQRQFLGRPDIVGRRLRLTNGNSIEVVGVMGPELETLSASMPTQCWFPEAPDPLQPRAGIYTVIGRLAPGVSIEQASAEAETIGKASVTPSFKGEPRVLRSMALLDRIVGRVETQLTFLFWAVVCVLLVTSANVVNLFLAHASGRRDELATRTALGATRARLVRQTLTESLLVSLLGGGLGFLLAVWGVPLLVAMAPEDVPRLQQIGVDWTTFAFTAIVSGAVGVLCGLVASMPARRPTSAVPGSTRVTARGTSRFRQGLTVCEIALALMLVVAATLMVRTVRALGDIELGFDPTQVIYAPLPSVVPWNLSRSQELHAAVVERVKALPGVRAAGVGIGPLSPGGMFTGGLVAAGNPRSFDMVRVDAVSPGYFEALGARLVAGRFFQPSDTSGPVVILVNEAAAHAFWGDADPIGKTVNHNDHSEEVIGVVANLREGQLEDEPGLTIYQLSNQSRNFLAGTMLIRVDGDAETLVPSIRSIIRTLAPQQPFSGVTPLRERLDRAMAPKLFVLRVIGLFSVLGLVLAVVGVYGVLAEFVAQRIPEIGIRIAIGATSADVLALILRHGTRLVAVGVALGLAGAVLLRGAMTTLVYGVPTLDPVAYLTACLCLLAATIAACTVPARRAARLDPVTALRLGT